MSKTNMERLTSINSEIMNAAMRAECDRITRTYQAKVTKKPNGFLAVATSRKQLSTSQAPALTVTAHAKQTTPAPTKGISDMPATAPSKRMVVSMPRVIAPNLKAFATTEDAYGAGMAMLAAVGRWYEPRNLIAEQFCNERGMPVLNVATVAQPTAGGYLVPDALSEAIIKNMSRIGAARRLSMYAPMNSNTLNVPIERGGPTVYSVTEMGTITGTDSEWGSIRLEPTKRGVLGYVSQELNDDALVRFVDTYADRAAHALARWEDKEFAIGDGTSTYGGTVGLIHSLGAAGISEATGADSWEDLTIAHFAAAMGKLPEQFSDGRESWCCSAAFYAMGMLRAAGGSSQGFAEDGRPLFLSKPVNILPAMPATSAAEQICCTYGNYAEACVFGDRGLTFAISDKCPEVFASDKIAVRALSRYKINVHGGGDASTAGAYVGLKTAASS